MVDTVNSVIVCKWCRQILVKPILLPCGETICWSHQDHFRQDPTCAVCGSQHKLPRRLFPPNKAMEILLEADIGRLDFGSSHRDACDNVKELRDQMNEYETRRDDPFGYIQSYFASLKADIESTRDNLVSQINQCSERLLDEIGEYELRCRESYERRKRKNGGGNDDDRVINRIRIDLNDWECKIRRLILDEQLWRNINDKSDGYLQQIDEQKYDLLLGRSNLTEFQTRYLNLFDLFSQDIGFNTEKQGKFQLEINKVSELASLRTTKYFMSEKIHYVGNYPFRIDARFAPSANGNITLGFYLTSDFYSSLKNWKIKVDYDLNLLDKTKSKTSYSINSSASFESDQKMVWGLREYLPLKKILEDRDLDAYNEDADSICLEVHIKSINPSISYKK